MRVGGTQQIDLDVRVIAATNKNLEEMIQNGTFREDLYYRLNVVSLNIPPLRERNEDIVPLINHFLAVINQKYQTSKSFLYDTIDAFENYSWPGNVRELENVLENLVITTPEDVIALKNLPQKFQDAVPERLPLHGPADADDEIYPLKETMDRIERSIINHAIQQCGSVRKAASALKVNPSTIVRKLQSTRDSSALDEK